jgi:hypothetical protein
MKKILSVLKVAIILVAFFFPFYPVAGLDTFTTEELLAVKEQVKYEVISNPGISGIAVGDGEIIIYRDATLAYPESDLPDALKKVPYRFQESKQLNILDAPPPEVAFPVRRVRPAGGGVSIGHYTITAGTLGTVVCDAKTGEKLILSNNHVLAKVNEGLIGDPIVQPGPYDGGIVGRDTIAVLLRYVKIFRSDGSVFTPDNLVDAAIAKPVSPGLVTTNIINIGEVDGITNAYVGMQVRKMGRTSGYTDRGAVVAVHGTFKVGMDKKGKDVAIFEEQIVVSAGMALPGDSGSLVVDAHSQKAVGLIFGGNREIGLMNRIDLVLYYTETKICDRGKIITSIIIKRLPPNFGR